MFRNFFKAGNYSNGNTKELLYDWEITRGKIFKLKIVKIITQLIIKRSFQCFIRAMLKIMFILYSFVAVTTESFLLIIKWSLKSVQKMLLNDHYRHSIMFKKRSFALICYLFFKFYAKQILFYDLLNKFCIIK